MILFRSQSFCVIRKITVYEKTPQGKTGLEPCGAVRRTASETPSRVGGETMAAIDHARLLHHRNARAISVNRAVPLCRPSVKVCPGDDRCLAWGVGPTVHDQTQRDFRMSPQAAWLTTVAFRILGVVLGWSTLEANTCYHCPHTYFVSRHDQAPYTFYSISL